MSKFDRNFGGSGEPFPYSRPSREGGKGIIRLQVEPEFNYPDDGKPPSHNTATKAGRFVLALANRPPRLTNIPWIEIAETQIALAEENERLALVTQLEDIDRAFAGIIARPRSSEIDLATG